MRSALRAAAAVVATLLVIAPPAAIWVDAQSRPLAESRVMFTLGTLWLLGATLVIATALLLLRAVLRSERRAAALQTGLLGRIAEDRGTPLTLTGAVRVLIEDRIPPGEWLAMRKVLDAQDSRSHDLETIEKRLARLEVLLGRTSAGAPARVRLAALRDNSALLALHSLYQLAGPPLPTTDFAALPATILDLCSRVVAMPTGGLAVETGSGVSTLWMALAAKRRSSPVRIVALEHSEVYAAQTREALVRNGVDGLAEVRLAPLEPLQGDDATSWYSRSEWEDLHNIDLLFVDGPPAASGPDARAAVISALGERLSVNAVVVVDDTNRDSERRLVDVWLELDLGSRRLQVVEEGERVTVLAFGSPPGERLGA